MSSVNMRSPLINQIRGGERSMTSTPHALNVDNLSITDDGLGNTSSFGDTTAFTGQQAAFRVLPPPATCLLMHRAIDSAPDAAEILLEPGVHVLEREVNISKSLTIQGNGPGVRITGKGLRVHGPGVTVRMNNVHFEDISGAAAVWVWGGAEVIMEGCHVSRSAMEPDHRGAAICVGAVESWGDGFDLDWYQIPESALRGGHVDDSATKLRCQRVRLHNVAGQGFMVRHGATAALDDCEVEGCGAWGVDVSGAGTECIVTNTVVTGAVGGAVDVALGAKATVEKCQLENCGKAGVTVTTAGTEAILRSNRIRKNGTWGIWGYEGCQVTVDSNMCTANKEGIMHMENCNFTDLTPKPRIIVPRDQPTVEMALDKIPDNGVIALEPGVYQPRRALRVLKSVDFEGIGDEGSAVIEHAEFLAKGPNVTMRLMNLTLADSDDNAVAVEDGATVLVEDCEVFGSRACGIEVSGVGSSVTVQYSVIHRSEFHGVQAIHGGEAHVLSTEITASSKSGVSCQGFGSKLAADSCVISACEDAAAQVDEAAQIMITNCVLHGNVSDGIRVNGESTVATLQGNEIHENEIGIWGWRGAYINATDNNVTNNTRADHELEDGCKMNETPVHLSIPAWAGLKPRPPRSRFNRPSTAIVNSGVHLHDGTTSRWGAGKTKGPEIGRPLLAVYDSPNSNKALHTRPIHRGEDTEWKATVGEERPFLVEGSLTKAEKVQGELAKQQIYEEYLEAGKDLLENVLCGPEAKHDLNPWESNFDEYGQWDYKSLSIPEQAVYFRELEVKRAERSAALEAVKSERAAAHAALVAAAADA